jgi:hypothetical protein
MLGEDTAQWVGRINQDRVEARELRCRAVRPDSPDISALATT